MHRFRFLIDNASWLFAGLILAFGSSFGQTFFISLFGAEYRAELGLSHGEFGVLYMGATLLSAMMLVQFGGVADRVPSRLLGACVLLALALACLGMSQVSAVWQLFILIFALRFLGQGMLSHIEATAIARWFAASRGKALAIASWGHPIGEGLLPLIVASLAALMPWRDVWMLCAGLIALGLAPLFLTVLRGERVPQGNEAAHKIVGMEDRHWTRREAIRTRLFWTVLLVLAASPMFGTAVLFHQAHIVEIKGWSLGQYAAGFPVYAVLSVAFSFLFGALVDRFSAQQMLPFTLIPISIGLATMGVFSSPWVALVTLGMVGAGAGASFATTGAMWAELFGTRHLGSIRAISSAAMVFASALGPGLTGALIDLGVGFERQCVVMGAWCFAMALVLFRVMHRKP